jgi:hypothetical protein
MMSESRKPMQLRVGNIFQYLGGFGLYVSLAEPVVDPRTPARVLLFVRNISASGPVVAMSLPVDTVCAVSDSCYVLARESYGDMTKVRNEHREHFETRDQEES